MFLVLPFVTTGPCNMRLLPRILVETRMLSRDNTVSISSIIIPKRMLATAKVNGRSPRMRKTVISKMTSDEITVVAETDLTILNLRSALLERCGREKGHRSVSKYAIACSIANDLLMLRTYMVQKIETLTKDVLSNANQENFRELTEVCLARRIMFNKCTKLWRRSF